ncbi:MotE family protein [Albibacillus kandeliae]|uniref:MotE family protein n=1 Tax=Albibacillus kandeliae TaxID=2174228 RepID=UPI001E34818E|nr:hypothetical protein [Albibacillus kandeliae]
MIRPRPITLMLGALVLAGAAKTATSLLSPEAPVDPDSLFVSAASAAGNAAPAAPAAPAAEAPAPQQCEQTPEAMLDAMREERELLDQQKTRLSERQAEIELAEEKLQMDQTQLSDLKGELEDLLAKVKKAQTDDVDRLVALYSAMKPKEAAAIMDDLDIEVSVMVLGTMPERDAAPILAKLNPTRARAISRIILERSKLPGDQRLDNLKL